MPGSYNDEQAAIHAYWFGSGPQTAAYFRERFRQWFMGGPEVDAEIKSLFGPLVERAGAGKLDGWAENPSGALALVLLLDQFSLNIHRNLARGYEYSDKAVPIARDLMRRGLDRTFSPAERIFAYMPLEHSEEMADQDASVAAFKRLLEESPEELKEVMKGSLDYAVRHHKVVARFGRFPHRNEALGRESTKAELEFLASSAAPF